MWLRDKKCYNEIVIIGTWEAPRLCGLNNTLRGAHRVSLFVDILYVRFRGVYYLFSYCFNHETNLESYCVSQVERQEVMEVEAWGRSHTDFFIQETERYEWWLSAYVLLFPGVLFVCFLSVKHIKPHDTDPHIEDESSILTYILLYTQRSISKVSPNPVSWIKMAFGLKA